MRWIPLEPEPVILCFPGTSGTHFLRLGQQGRRLDWTKEQGQQPGEPPQGKGKSLWGKTLRNLLNWNSAKNKYSVLLSPEQCTQEVCNDGWVSERPWNLVFTRHAATIKQCQQPTLAESASSHKNSFEDFYRTKAVFAGKTLGTEVRKAAPNTLRRDLGQEPWLSVSQDWSLRAQMPRSTRKTGATTGVHSENNCIWKQSLNMCVIFSGDKADQTKKASTSHLWRFPIWFWESCSLLIQRASNPQRRLRHLPA